MTSSRIAAFLATALLAGAACGSKDKTPATSSVPSTPEFAEQDEVTPPNETPASEGDQPIAPEDQVYFALDSDDGGAVESVAGRARSGARAASMPSVTSTTGPLNNVAVGIRSDHTTPGGYTAARSHRMPDRMQQSCSGCGERASFFICVASR